MWIETLLFRYAWLIFVAVTLANAAIWWTRAQPHIRKNPSKRATYIALVRAFAIFGSLPWIIMGIGILAGAVPTVWDYLDIRAGPFVLAWWALVVSLWIAWAYWTFRRQGAKALIDHPGLLGDWVRSEPLVKAYTSWQSLAASQAWVSLSPGQ